MHTKQLKSFYFSCIRSRYTVKLEPQLPTKSPNISIKYVLECENHADSRQKYRFPVPVFWAAFFRFLRVRYGRSTALISSSDVLGCITPFIQMHYKAILTPRNVQHIHIYRQKLQNTPLSRDLHFAKLFAQIPYDIITQTHHFVSSLRY